MADGVSTMSLACLRAALFFVRLGLAQHGLGPSRRIPSPPPPFGALGDRCFGWISSAWRHGGPRRRPRYLGRRRTFSTHASE